MRPTFDDYFLAIAEVVSSRATCKRRKIGVVIVDKEHRILATGTNGQPSGMPHCIDTDCIMNGEHCTSVHGEMNALLYCQNRASLKESTCYIVGGTPCSTCANALITVGTKRIVCDREYPDTISIELLKLAKVQLEIRTKPL